MAKSPAHQFGQRLGALIEEIVLDEVLRPQLEQFTRERGYWLDAKGKRPARSSVKVSWPDRWGNTHDLDFVIEIGGSATQRGRPIAFIEAAWRRYTKHSKNKAQEIQGAILPLVDMHRDQAPFHGVVLAGEFTQPAVAQLRSLGFSVAHLPYADVVSAFRAAGLNVGFDASTPTSTFTAATRQLARLTADQRSQIRRAIVASARTQINEFMTKLRAVLSRIVAQVCVRTTWGEDHAFTDIAAARQGIGALDVKHPQGQFLRYEVRVRYSNGDTIDASFETALSAIAFLDRIG
jgi:hypothetical protein